MQCCYRTSQRQPVKETSDRTIVYEQFFNHNDQRMSVFEIIIENKSRIILPRPFDKKFKIGVYGI